ncbi:hypothetical protein [Mycoplasmopsis lipofaciens]|uniref:hypothetical protein n=1 Tax=Mycoplasmopsis lipofaciens TaxID=114884 RepID=UPI0004861F16|nr:hypothetical protein [Mycoplasmopsis lipofaciens]
MFKTFKDRQIAIIVFVSLALFFQLLSLLLIGSYVIVSFVMILAAAIMMSLGYYVYSAYINAIHNYNNFKNSSLIRLLFIISLSATAVSLVLSFVLIFIYTISNYVIFQLFIALTLMALITAFITLIVYLVFFILQSNHIQTFKKS